MTFHIELFKGAEAKPYVRPLSEMRVQEFSQFPYLYVGNAEDDLAYIPNSLPHRPRGC